MCQIHSECLPVWLPIIFMSHLWWMTSSINLAIYFYTLSSFCLLFSSVILISVCRANIPPPATVTPYPETIHLLFFNKLPVKNKIKMMNNKKSFLLVLLFTTLELSFVYVLCYMCLCKFICGFELSCPCLHHRHNIKWQVTNGQIWNYILGPSYSPQNL